VGEGDDLGLAGAVASIDGRVGLQQGLVPAAQFPDGHRLRRAVRVVRVIAANRGDRLERFMPSTDPARRRTFVTRYMRHGHGDELSARDAMAAARAAMTSVKDMHRATTFEAGNPHSIARTEFETMAQAADECITKVAGLDTVGPQVVRRENTSLLAQMIAELEARFTEPAAG
jgi:hypothetical protein